MLTCAFLGMGSDHIFGLMIAGITAFALTMVGVALLLRTIVSPKEIAGGVVWIKGASEAFLQSVDQWKGTSAK